jgi:hypothetical protein
MSPPELSRENLPLLYNGCMKYMMSKLALGMAEECLDLTKTRKNMVIFT